MSQTVTVSDESAANRVPSDEKLIEVTPERWLNYCNVRPVSLSRNSTMPLPEPTATASPEGAYAKLQTALAARWSLHTLQRGLSDPKSKKRNENPGRSVPATSCWPSGLNTRAFTVAWNLSHSFRRLLPCDRSRSQTKTCLSCPPEARRLPSGETAR